jgi:hypothetical protein
MTLYMQYNSACNTTVIEQNQLTSASVRRVPKLAPKTNSVFSAI